MHVRAAYDSANDSLSHICKFYQRWRPIKGGHYKYSDSVSNSKVEHWCIDPEVAGSSLAVVNISLSINPVKFSLRCIT